MFKQLLIFLTLIALYVYTEPINYPTEEQAKAELKTAGMSQTSIDGLSVLTQKFVSGYPIVQANKEKADKFLAEYTTEVQNFIHSMSPEDQTIYNNYLVKYGLA